MFKDKYVICGYAVMTGYRNLKKLFNRVLQRFDEHPLLFLRSFT